MFSNNIKSIALDCCQQPCPSTETCLPVHYSFSPRKSAACLQESLLSLFLKTIWTLFSLRRTTWWTLFPPRERLDTAFYRILTQIWWFVRRSCSRQQSLQLLPLQSAVKGLLFAKGGEGPLCRGLRLWSFKHLGVWNRVHARDMQIAAVIGSLASIRRDKRRHPAPIRVAQGFTFLGAVGEEIHTCEREKETADVGFTSVALGIALKDHRQHKEWCLVFTIFLSSPKNGPNSLCITLLRRRVLAKRCLGQMFLNYSLYWGKIDWL